MKSNADYLCSILEKNSASSTETKIEGLIYAVSILTEFAVEKLPAILNEQISYLQSQINDISSKLDNMQNYSAMPANNFPPIPSSPGFNSPKPTSNPPPRMSPAPKKSEPINMQDELRQVLARRRKIE